MRPARLTSMVALWLLTSAACAYGQDDSQRRAPHLRLNKRGQKVAAFFGIPGAKPVVSANDPAWTVKGFGETNEDAREDATKRAHTEVKAFLERNTPLQWRPTVEYVRARL